MYAAEIVIKEKKKMKQEAINQKHTVQKHPHWLDEYRRV
jgi:hypothetical protein